MTIRKAPRPPFDDVTARARLYAISRGEPDTKLSRHLNDAVPELVRRGWLQACGHSDGDYVRITDKGQRVLDALL